MLAYKSHNEIFLIRKNMVLNLCVDDCWVPDQRVKLASGIWLYTNPVKTGSRG